jgi:dTDP-4-dehydrorhamnose reductase
MLELGLQRADLRVVADQAGTPSYAGDLAELVGRLIERLQAGATLPSWGIHHAVGGDATTWHGFAVEIFREAALFNHAFGQVAISPIRSDEYAAAARRPRNGVLEPSGQLAQMLDYRPDWRVGLRRTLAELAPITAECLK